MYVGFTKLFLFAIGIGAAQTLTAIASSSSSSGTATTDLINSDVDAASSSNGNIGNRLLQDEETVCVCSPSTYTFTFDFSGTCPGNIDNEGVIEQVCFINAPDSPGANLTPVRVTGLTVFELDEDFIVVSQQPYLNGPYFDGDTIQYTSISDALDPNLSLDDQLTKVPKYIQFQILGGNEQGEVLQNMFVIEYTLSCEVEPVAIGNQKGWVEISDYEPAIPAFCGAVTYAPTVTPSEAPTESPTTAAPTITSSPSEAPTESSTFNSMSYHSASFSVSHAKTAKSKAVKAKGGKISKRT
ncbi:hypothetical protein ACHAWC_005920 [Mediolabrus comicus]